MRLMQHYYSESRLGESYFSAPSRPRGAEERRLRPPWTALVLSLSLSLSARSTAQAVSSASTGTVAHVPGYWGTLRTIGTVLWSLQ